MVFTDNNKFVHLRLKLDISFKKNIIINQILSLKT